MAEDVITDRYHALAFSMELLGRESELAACLSASVSLQTPVGIVIAGAPGIGKTTLFRAVIDAVAMSKRRVVVTTGLSGEANVPLANLADLLDPAAGDVLAQLPAVQADA